MRLKILVEPNKKYTKNHFEFFIDDFPYRVNKDDLISLSDMFKEEGFSEKEIDQIYALSYSVDFVSWEKDEKGIYQKAFCVGE